MGYLALGIIIGIFIGKYLFILLDMLIELASSFIGHRSSIYQAKVEFLKFRLEAKCGNKQPAIGFNMRNDESSLIEEDDEEDCDDDFIEDDKLDLKLQPKNRIGF